MGVWTGLRKEFEEVLVGGVEKPGDLGAVEIQGHHLSGCRVEVPLHCFIDVKTGRKG